MMRSDPPAVLTDEVARFQAEVRRLALAAVQAIVKTELDRKRAALPAARRAPRATKAREKAATFATPATSSSSSSSSSTPSPSPSPSPSASRGAAPATLAAPPGTRKRMQWTHESIVSELAGWMLSGTAIDAAFVNRHGPPGLVPAARRIFGRFDAALNVAALHISKLHPDGPPAR